MNCRNPVTTLKHAILQLIHPLHEIILCNAMAATDSFVQPVNKASSDVTVVRFVDPCRYCPTVIREQGCRLAVQTNDSRNWLLLQRKLRNEQVHSAHKQVSARY